MSTDIDDLPDVAEPEFGSGEYERLTERGLTRAHVVRDLRRVVGHCGSARAAAVALDLGVSTVFNLMSGNSAVGPRVLDQLYGTEGGDLPAKYAGQLPDPDAGDDGDDQQDTTAAHVPAAVAMEAANLAPAPAASAVTHSAAALEPEAAGEMPPPAPATEPYEVTGVAKVSLIDPDAIATAVIDIIDCPYRAAIDALRDDRNITEAAIIEHTRTLQARLVAIDSAIDALKVLAA